MADEHPVEAADAGVASGSDMSGVGGVLLQRLQAVELKIDSNRVAA